MPKVAQRASKEEQPEANEPIMPYFRKEEYKETVETFIRLSRKESGDAGQRYFLLRLLQWRFSLEDEQQAYYTQQLQRIDDWRVFMRLTADLLSASSLDDFSKALASYLPK